jgi:hypothetical protein
MTKTEYAEYLNTERWKELRRAALRRDDNTCQKCEITRWLAAIVYDQDLHVHHTSYIRRGQDGELNDLESLCRRCHELETFGRTDLKEPPSAICVTCGQKHWNAYANECEFCHKLLRVYCGFIGQWLDLGSGVETETRKRLPLSWTLLWSLCCRLSNKQVTATLTEMRKKLIDDHGNFCAACKEGITPCPTLTDRDAA